MLADVKLLFRAAKQARNSLNLANPQCNKNYPSLCIQPNEHSDHKNACKRFIIMKELIKKKSPEVWGQVDRYKRALSWIWSRAYIPNQALAVWATVLMLSALLLKFSALGLVLKYLHLLESGHSISVLSYTVEKPQDSLPLLLTVTSFALALFLLSSVMQYLSELQTLRLAVRVETQCTAKTIHLIAKVGNHPNLYRFKPFYSRIIGLDVRYCGTSSRVLLRCVLPIISGLGSLTVLFYLDTSLTLTLLCLVLIALPFLYRVSVRGALHSKSFEALSPKAALEKRQIVKDYVAAEEQNRSGEELITQFTKNSTLTRALEAYLGRIVASSETTFISAMLMASAIFILLLQKGTQLLDSGYGWGQLATYLVVLRLCLAGFSQLMGLLAAFNRTYPQVSRYIRFEHVAEQLVSTGLVAYASKDIWSTTKASGSIQREDDEILEE